MGSSLKKLPLAGALTGLMLLVAASPAYSVDVPAKPIYKAAPAVPQVVMPYSWTGFYLGGNAGFGWGGSVETDPVTGVQVAFIHATGPGAGGQAGFNYQIGRIVIGAQGDLDWINVNGTNPSCGFGMLTCHGHNVWFDTAVGRLGYAFDRLLLYAKGGAAWLHEEFQQNANPGNTTICVVPCTGSATYRGWTVGGGFEYAFLANLSVWLDYEYAQFPKQLITSSNSVGEVHVVNITHRANLVRIGLNYKFDWGKAPFIGKGKQPLVAKY